MSSVQKLGVPVFLFTTTAVHYSLKSSREQGEREPPNLPITSLRAIVILYFMIAKVMYR